MKLNMFQQSIARTRVKIREANRLAAAMVRQVRQDKERANSSLQLLLDEIAAETGLAITPENMPTIMIYVQQFLEDQARNREEADGGVGGMEDYPL